jgi:hypothetical protein
MAFDLPKYSNIVIDADTQVQDLPWTPARYIKFKDAVDAELSLSCDYVGTLQSIVNDLASGIFYVSSVKFGSRAQATMSTQVGNWPTKSMHSCLKRFWTWAVVTTHSKDVFTT